MSSQVLTQTKSSSWSKDLFSILLGSFILAIFAHVKIPLPFTPVPIVTQNFIAILLGIVLGPKKGVLSVGAFLFQGLIGFPVFSGSFTGLAVLLGPTGGYLIGYLVSAHIAGTMSKNKTAYRLAAAMLAGLACQYVLGMAQLSFFVGFKNVFFLGCAPFIVGDLLKMGISLAVLKKAFSH